MPDGMVRIAPKHRRMVVPYVPQLEKLAPGAVRFDIDGQPHLALHHDAEHVKLARNFGFEAAAPILSYYDWNRRTPFASQMDTAAMLTIEKRAYVLNGMGTGKTRAVLWAHDFLMKDGAVGPMLVVAPLSTLVGTWVREAFAVVPHRRILVLHGTRKKRLATLAKPADIYVINHDGVESVMQEIIDRTDIQLVVLDELAVYRNGGTKRFRDMRRILTAKDRAWGLTGGPVPNAPTDAWAQCKLITPWTIPEGFTRFREQVMLKVSQFKWVARHTALATVHAAMQPAVRFTLDDVVELPETVMRQMPVVQTKAQVEVYTKLRTHLRAMFDRGEITIANSGVLMNKLLQVSMGWVYTNAHQTVALDNRPRLEALHDIILSTDQKVIVFVPFIHAIDGVAEYLRSKRISFSQVSGATPRARRDRIFHQFQNAEQPHVLLAHPECMSHGLTLTAADTIIWFGPYASPETFDQANARIVRVGQRHRTQIIMLEGTQEESRLYKRLAQKAGVQSLLLDMFSDDMQKETSHP